MPRAVILSGLRLMVVVIALAVAGVALVTVAAFLLRDRAPSIPEAEVIEEWACEFSEPVGVDTRSFVFPVELTDSSACEITTSPAKAMTSPSEYLCRLEPELFDPGLQVTAVDLRFWIRPTGWGRFERCRFATSDGERVVLWEISHRSNPSLLVPR